MEQKLEQTLLSAQKGNLFSREELIKNNRSFIVSVSAGVCNRFLSWDNDDELSVALLAFNEAIDRFKPCEGMAFHNFARKIIKSRLIDYFRKESRHRCVSLLPMEYDNEELRRYDMKCSFEHYNEEKQQAIFAEAIEIYIKVLEQYKVTLDDLVKSSPKHKNRKETMMKAARILSNEPELVKYLRKFKCLPLKELERLTGLSRRTLEKGRKYLIALVLILTEPGFYPLKSFIQMPGSSTGEKVSQQ